MHSIRGFPGISVIPYYELLVWFMIRKAVLASKVITELTIIITQQ